MSIKKYLGVVMITFVLMWTGSNLAAAEDNINLGTVDVTGTASINVAPNQGVVRISIENLNKEAKTAATENAKVMANIQSRLLGLAIPNDKIQTVDYSVYPEYSNRDGSQVIVGYHANNTIAVTVDDLNKISTVVDTALAAGANSISAIDLGVKDVNQYKNQVLTEAIANAKEQASVVASALGKNVVGVKHINIYNNSTSGNYRAMSYAASKENSLGDNVATPIQGGTLQLKASVNGTFYIQ